MNPESSRIKELLYLDTLIKINAFCREAAVEFFYGVYFCELFYFAAGFSGEGNNPFANSGGSFVSWAPGEPAGREGYSVLEGTNWYGYCSNNPIKYVDPDGMIQVSPNGGFCFWPNRYSNGNIIVYKDKGNRGNKISTHHGYIRANDGTKIEVRYNLDRKTAPWDNFDCHGFTFTNGTFWIDNEQVEKILENIAII